jgi:hypothetical protein
MTFNRQLPDDQPQTRELRATERPFRGASRVVFTQDHEVIKRWAAERHAEPATGQASRSGPATFKVNDGGAGIRFNFPGVGAFRPISWDEWFGNFDDHECAFVYDDDPKRPPSSQYRIVKAAEWQNLLW